MSPTAEQALLDLIEDIFSSSCISVSSDASSPKEYRTTTLLLHSARSASLTQRIELLLQLLLSHPPFTHTSPALLSAHQLRFLTIWSRDNGTPPSASVHGTLAPNRCLDLLAAIRVDFQRLGETGFRFASDLLLSCLQRLTPESSSRNQNTRGGWVAAHGTAVSVLEELLFSVPPADWLRLDAHSEHAAPVWRCLQLLCSGASWWSNADQGDVFRENLERLGRCVFSLPNASSLLRAALRVDMPPGDIHSTVTTLLTPLERALGVYNDARINAFTPTPFSFPTLLALDRHDFEKAYEFDSLRVMFVAWINADAAHRKREDFRNPWRMETVLQHSDAWKKLKAHPESCVRVALVYIFNEVQLGCEGFKPSTDAKAIELLKIYIAHKHVQKTKRASPAIPRVAPRQDEQRDRPEACVVQNAEWVMPWLWKRRAVDMEFAMIVTSAWLISKCGNGNRIYVGHPVCRLVEKYSEAAFEVFHGFFKTVFSYEFVTNSADQQSALAQIRTLLGVVLDVFLLLGRDNNALLNSQLCLLIIRAYVDSLEHEWITPECWSAASEIFTLVPRLSLTEAVKLAQITSGIELFVPIFLREIEEITSICVNSTPGTLPTAILAGQLSTLTSTLQFTGLLARACDSFGSLLSKKSHFITTARLYASKGYEDLLVRSEKPELYWAHSASIGAVLEVLVSTGFGNSQSLGVSPTDANTGKKGSDALKRNDEVGQLVMKILNRTWEMCYVISGLCGLVQVIIPSWWEKRPFVYLQVWSCIRGILLDPDMHKFCSLLPTINAGLTALLAVRFPTTKLLLNSRWNLTLSSSLVVFLLSPSLHLSCPVCHLPTGIQVCALLTTLLSRNPSWKLDLLKSAGMGGYSTMDLDILEKRIEELMAAGRFEEVSAFVSVGRCFESWAAKAGTWARRCERERKAAGAKQMETGWYRVYRPVEGMDALLVPA